MSTSSRFGRDDARVLPFASHYRQAFDMTLRIITEVFAALAVLGALIAVRPAPAVTIAIAAGLAAGAATYAFVIGGGPHGVPAAVSEGFSVGIVVGSVVGLVVTRRREPGTWPMRRDAVWLLALTPFAAAALLLAVQEACPLYVTRGAGLCFYDFDLLGGWAAGVAFLFVIDMLLLVGVLWLSPGRRRAAHAEGRAR
jgi:hypothetical protein